MGNSERVPDIKNFELRTFYARADWTDLPMTESCCRPVTFMNKRGVFEVDMHMDMHNAIPDHDEVVAITFDQHTRIVTSITSPFEPKFTYMDQTTDDYDFQQIRIRGYWRNPNH